MCSDPLCAPPRYPSPNKHTVIRSATLVHIILPVSTILAQKYFDKDTAFNRIPKLKVVIHDGKTMQACFG